MTIIIGWEYFLGIMAGLIGIAYYTGGRFSVIETSISWIKESVAKIEDRLTKLEGKADTSFSSQSPIKLLPRGEEILIKSGMKEYIDNHKNSLFDICKSTLVMENQYDIQESIFSFFSTYDFGTFQNNLKEAAFSYGSSLEVVRRIGAIYFRDICLSEHGYKPEDLDQPKTT